MNFIILWSPYIITGQQISNKYFLLRIGLHMLYRPLFKTCNFISFNYALLPFPFSALFGIRIRRYLTFSVGAKLFKCYSFSFDLVNWSFSKGFVLLNLVRGYWIVVCYLFCFYSFVSWEFRIFTRFGVHFWAVSMRLWRDFFTVCFWVGILSSRYFFGIFLQGVLEFALFRKISLFWYLKKWVFTFYVRWVEWYGLSRSTFFVL